MSSKIWKKVDEYIESLVVPENANLQQTRKYSNRNSLPEINVSPAQGKLLQLLVKMSGSKRILEIGTLGGYSTIWIAGAANDIQITTIEANEHHAKTAQNNFNRAKLTDRIHLICSDGKTAIERMIRSGSQPFDFIFLDADKFNNPIYLDLCLQLSHPGTIIICDNVVRKGELINEQSADPDVQGMREYCEKIGSNSSLHSTVIQTVGRKGYDGFTISVVE